MQHANAFLGNLAVVLCVAAATTVLFHRMRQPVVLGYILAGLIVGPYVPVPLVADRAIVQELSELGVILLLFSIGLEFTFGKLLRVGGLAAVIAVAQVSVMLLLGDLAGRALGWTPREALYAGAIVAISSTTIIAKARKCSSTRAASPDGCESWSCRCSSSRIWWESCSSQD